MSKHLSSLHIHPFANNSFATFYTQGASPKTVLTRALSHNMSVIITGPKGSGKTHLIQALSQHMTQHGIHHLLTSAPLLIKSLVTANIRKNIKDLKIFFLDFPLILLDDIHALLRSKAAQDLVLLAMEHNTTIISTALPRQCALLHPKIFDRLKGATTLSLAGPSAEHTHYALELYAKELGTTLSAEEYAFLNTSNLDVNAQKALVSLKKRKGIAIENTLLHTQESLQKRLVPQKIINAISTTRHITAEDLCKTRPQKNVQNLQDLCIFLCRTHGAPLENLCTLFNKKHYASIHASCDRAQTLLSHNASTFEVLRDIEKHLTATP